MSVELTDEYIEFVIEKLQEHNDEVLREQFDLLHPADIAEIMVNVPDEFALRILNLFDNEKNGRIISELEQDQRSHLLEVLTPKEIADVVIDNMESDDAVDLLAELDEELKDEIIAELDNKDYANQLIDLLSYPEDSAGGLMAKEFVKININWTVHECIVELRKQAEEVANVHTVYAVDNQDILVGIISLKQLILSSPQLQAKELIKEDIIKAYVTDSSVDVALKMEKYDLVVIPVIDNHDKLLGRITIDDVVDIIKEEAEKDYQLASGITDDVEYDASIYQLTKARFPWLLVGLIGGVTGAKIVGLFGVVEKVPMLAYFMPLIAAMGGNVGVQSSAIVVQSIANNSLKGSISKKLIKELGVGLFNGFLCASILLIFNIFFADSLNISLTVSLSLFAVIIFAAIFGTWIPLILNRFNVDPALATGPFITTANDIMGLMIYFSISYYLVF